MSELNLCPSCYEVEVDEVRSLRTSDGRLVCSESCREKWESHYETDFGPSVLDNLDDASLLSKYKSLLYKNDRMYSDRKRSNDIFNIEAEMLRRMKNPQKKFPTTKSMSMFSSDKSTESSNTLTDLPLDSYSVLQGKKQLLLEIKQLLKDDYDLEEIMSHLSRTYGKL